MFMNMVIDIFRDSFHNIIILFITYTDSTNKHTHEKEKRLKDTD